MYFGKVTGTVVASRKDEKLEGLKLLFVQQVDASGKITSTYVVAADAVGAGMGEMVMFATGSSARQTTATEGKPVDAVVMAIVDTWEIGGKVVYDKYDQEAVSV
ncbi:MAG: EutN/CcmL family microcompartment protein [Nitrospinae bacterium]|nr:EutN/CcmL family microcompartment protein [Nitrospinota bacterium]